MALSTYSELKDAAVLRLGRDGDASLPSWVENAVALAEARFNRVLRVAEMEAEATGTSTNGLYEIPEDFLEVRRVYVEGYPESALVGLGWAQDHYSTVTEGAPAFYHIRGLTLEAIPHPADDTELIIDYYQKIPALSDAAPTNWLLESHYDLYLSATVMELADFAMNDVELTKAATRVNTILDEIQRLDRSKRWARPVSRVKGHTP
jgi:hypothetical protein